MGFRVGPCCHRKHHLSAAEGDLPLTALGWAQGFCHEASPPSALLEMCTKIKHDEEFISKGLIFWMG